MLTLVTSPSILHVMIVSQAMGLLVLMGIIAIKGTIVMMDGRDRLAIHDRNLRMVKMNVCCNWKNREMSSVQRLVSRQFCGRCDGMYHLEGRQLLKHAVYNYKECEYTHNISAPECISCYRL